MKQGLPTGLPLHSLDLIDQLVELNPAPVVRGNLTDPDQIQTLVFQAGRRDVVDELKRLADAARNG